jgi:hypothetical protein
MIPERRRAVGLAYPMLRERNNGVSSRHLGRNTGRGLPGDIRSRTVNGLKDGGVLSNVARRSESETADETGAHVGEDITIELRNGARGISFRRVLGSEPWEDKGPAHVRHDHHSVGVGGGVLDDTEADAIEEILIVLDVGVFGGKLAARAQEHTVGHLPVRQKRRRACQLKVQFASTEQTQTNMMGAL